MAKMTPAEKQKEIEMMRMMKAAPRDLVLRHLVQSTTPPSPTYKPKYIRTAFYSIKPGRFDDAVALFNEYAGVVYTDLAGRGTLGPWGLSVQEIASDPNWTHLVWYFVDDLRRMDSVRDSFMARPADLRNKVTMRLMEMSDPGKFRQEILYITHMNIALPPTARPR
jgi:hypothetical protein